MPFNLELKIKTVSHRKFEQILRQIGAEDKGILKQKDVYYKMKNGLLKLRIENGTYTLIKYLRDEKGKRWSNYELLKLEGKNPEKYLSEILMIEGVVEKQRKLFMYKNTRVHLDTVKGLGKFLELETLLVAGRKDAENRFCEIVEILNLDTDKQIRGSYKNLLMKK